MERNGINEMDRKYVGMTVNERLYVCGLLNQFDKAVKEKNVTEIIFLLKKVELTDESIGPILTSLGFSANKS